MSEEQRIERRRALGLLASLSTTGLLLNAEAGGMPGASQSAPEPPLDQRRDLRPTAADSGSLFPVIDKIASEHEYSHSLLGNRFRSVADYKKQGREVVLQAFGERPAPVDSRPEVVDRVDMGGFTREKILFSTTQNFRVPAYVHIPKGLSKRAPAIVDLHSHGGMFIFGKEKVIDLGRNHPVMLEYHKVNYGGRPTATALVRRGYVVITIDAFPFGERRLMLDEDLKYGWERSKYSVQDVKYLNSVCRRKESTVVKSLTYAGMTWPGIVTWDDMRTVDYLASRPEVDPARIGCVGVSFGGWRSLFLAGLDERIAAGCVVGFMSTTRDMVRRHMDTHSFVHFVPSLHRYLDLPDVVALRAPKPLLVQQCRRDALFPLSGMEDSVRKIAAIYEKAGAKANFVGRFYDAPHQFDPVMQENAFDWLDAQLKS